MEPVATAHAVVKVETGPRPVEADVAGQARPLSLGLEVAAHLFLEVTDLVEKVRFDDIPLREVADGSGERVGQ